MAIKKTMLFNMPGIGDIYVADCYIRIRPIIINKDMARITVSYRRDSDSVALPFTNEYDFMCKSGDGEKDHMTQAYDYIKSLQEFHGCVDC